MKRIASSDAVAVAPTYSADAGSQGHFGESPNPTHVTAKWMESVQEAVVRPIEDAGLTPSDDMDQFRNAIYGVHGIKSHATTLSATNVNRRVVIASSSGLSSGANSAVIASSVAQATGGASAVLASTGGGFGASCDATATNSLVAACDNSALASGDHSAVIASQSSTATAAGASVVGGASHNSTAANAACLGGNNSDATAAQAVCVGGDGNDATGTNSATVGGSSNAASGTRAVTAGGTSHVASSQDSGCFAGNNNTASTANNTVCIGGRDSTASGAEAAVVGGSTNTASGSSAFIAGSDGAAATSLNATIIGCDGGTAENETSVMLVASRNANLFNDGNPSGGGADGYCLAGGYNATPSATGANNNLTWILSSKHGTLALDNTTLITGADYAEMFPNAEPGELPAGVLLARSGGAVRVAKPGDRVVGVVSVAPSVLGDAAPLAWSGKHARDEWGRRLYDTDGEPVIVDGYDADRAYVPRGGRRDQWTAVALVGKVRVRIGPGVKVDDLLMPGADGCAAPVRASTREASGRPVEVMEIVTPYDQAQGYGVALCLVG